MCTTKDEDGWVLFIRDGSFRKRRHSISSVRAVPRGLFYIDGGKADAGRCMAGGATGSHPPPGGGRKETNTIIWLYLCHKV